MTRGNAMRPAGLVLLLVWSVFPIYWTLNTSLMTNIQAQSRPAQFLPLPPIGGNYGVLLKPSSAESLAASFLQSMINISIECAAATLLTLLIAVSSAYAFARMRFLFKRPLLVVVLATLMLPAYATLIPIYRLMSGLGLVNTYLGIVLVYTSGFLPLAMWIMYNFFVTIPRELEEAASIDGATPLQTLIRVILPVARSGVVATAIITFLLGWTQFIFPLVLSTDISTQPVTVLIASFQSRHEIPFTLLNAAAVIAILIPGALALTLNRYIISGILAGSQK